MKKFKEALLFIISLVLLIFGPLLWFVLYKPKGQIAFMSNWNYLKLLVKDEVFFRLILNTYAIPILVSFIVLLVLFFAKKRLVAKRGVFYPVCVAISSLISFIYLVIFYKHAYPPPFTVSVYDGIISLQVGMLVTFVIWIIETIIGCGVRRRTAKPVGDGVLDFPLFEIAKQNINDNRQITVLLTDTQNVYFSTELDGADVLGKLKSDPNVVTMLTMWQSGEVDLPSMAFRKSLVKLTQNNLQTDIVLRTADGYILKKLNITL